MIGARQAARLSDDFVDTFVEIEGAIDALIVAFGNERINFHSISLGIEKVAGDRIAHLFVSVAHAVIDGNPPGFEPLIEFFHLGRRVDAPGDMRDDFGIAFPAFGQSE
jgi:hypothetical protein